MAWIEVHQGIFRHRKTVTLASLLDVHRMSAAGHMISLWHWALDNAPDGDLSQLSDKMIAMAAEWPEDTAAYFVQSARVARFLDPDGMIHNWHDYVGKLIERRRADAQRKRAQRASTGQGGDTPADEQQDIGAESAPTVPYSTLQHHYLLTLRAIPGWQEKGEPHLANLLAWREARGITDDQMERSAIGLSGATSKTVKGYTNLASALQVRINKGWDGGVGLPVHPAGAAAAPTALDLTQLEDEVGAVALWSRSKGVVKLKMTGPIFQTLFAGLEPLGFIGGVLILRVANDFVASQAMRSIRIVEDAMGCGVEFHVGAVEA